MKRKRKKISSIIMASSLCLTTLTTNVVFAQYHSFEYNGVTNMYTDSLEDVAKQLLNYWNACENSFTIYYYIPHDTNLGEEYYKNIVNEASKYSNDSLPTEGDYIKYGLSNGTIVTTKQYTSYSNDSGQTTLMPYVDFIFNTSKNKNNTTYISSRIINIINDLELSSNASQYDKVKAVYDWVCNNITYEGSASTVDNIVNPISSNGNSLSCSLFVYRLLRTLGVQTRIVYGSLPSTSTHYWNIVSLDGHTWYHMDTSVGTLTKSDNYFLTTRDSIYHGTMDSEFSEGIFAMEHPIATDDYNPGESEVDPDLNPTHNLIIKNTTVGNGADINKVFNYTLNISKLTPNTTYTIRSTNELNPNNVVSNNSGTLTTTLSLKNDDIVVINNLQENAQYIVSRIDDSDGYTLTQSNANGTLTTNKVVLFKNAKELVVETGISTNIIPSIAILSASVGSFLFTRKKENI